jgi:hypothetical protein
MWRNNVAAAQGDQIGRIFAILSTVYFGQICSALAFSNFIHWKSFALNLTKYSLGYNLGDFSIKASGHPAAALPPLSHVYVITFWLRELKSCCSAMATAALFVDSDLYVHRYIRTLMYIPNALCPDSNRGSSDTMPPDGSFKGGHAEYA